MKNMLPFLTVIALAAAPVDLQTNPTTPVQPDASRPSQTGFVLKQLPFKIGHPQQAGGPRIKSADDASDLTSENWSGYASVGDTFTAVTGSWVVPTVSAGTKSGAAYAATWVGLDGYSSSTVEQTGTLQEWTGSKQENYAWFEMYPGPMYEIEGAPVTIGDTITATVLYAGSTTVSEGRGRSETEYVFLLTISDGTKWTYTVPQSYTTVTSASRSSAEWIMEAPASSEILPLADFGTDAFSGCAAMGSKGSGAIDSFWTPEPIIMEDPEGGESTPSGLTDSETVSSSFNVTWSAYTPPAPTRGGR